VAPASAAAVACCGGIPRNATLQYFVHKSGVAFLDIRPNQETLLDACGAPTRLRNKLAVALAAPQRTRPALLHSLHLYLELSRPARFRLLPSAWTRPQARPGVLPVAEPPGTASGEEIIVAVAAPVDGRGQRLPACRGGLPPGSAVVCVLNSTVRCKPGRDKEHW
jgi:hypothetical protein